MKLEQIRKLEEDGVLSRELCPTPSFWHWDVLKPELLPPDGHKDLYNFGEIRWYGSEG